MKFDKTLNMKLLKTTIGTAVLGGALVLSLLGLAVVPSALAQACCGGNAGSQAGCNMAGHAASGGHEGHGVAQATGLGQTSTPRQVFMQPVQSVFDNYIKVQGALAQDSLEGIGGTAGAMAKAIRGDSMKMLSPKIAEQAEALGQAMDLETARVAFKALSESLIAYLKEQKVPAGTYYVAYCPMAKASWLQTDRTIMNPYMGKGMIHCGQIKG
jgi:hypothetical protein